MVWRRSPSLSNKLMVPTMAWRLPSSTTNMQVPSNPMLMVVIGSSSWGVA